MTPSVFCLSAAIVTLFGSACSNGPVPTTGSGKPLDPTSRALIPIGSDTAFYAALKDALMRQSGDSSAVVTQTISEAVITTDSQAVSTGRADTSGSSSSSGGNARETTSTNVQEQGVQEQDWVKLNSSGNELFILKSEFTNRHLSEVGDDGPALSARSSIAVADSYTTQLRILNLDDEVPDSTTIHELELNLSGRYAQGFYLYEDGDQSSAYITSSGANYWAHWDSSTAFSGVDSLITEVNVSNPAAPTVNASFAFDGQMVSNRRIGKHLFFVSRYYPTLPGNKPWTQSAEDWADQVNSADLSTVLPKYYLNGEQSGNQLIDPAECYVANSNIQNDHYSPDIITLGVIDLETMDISDSECFLGATETLYASANAVFLATTRYDYSSGPVDIRGVAVDVNEIDLPADIAWSDPRVDTDIHQFGLEFGQLTYQGSGKIDGHLGWNALRKPFRMSEKDGYLRVATMNNEQGPGKSPILMTVLKANGQGLLETVSSLPNTRQPAHIGKPGEQLYASRFVGNRAYLVTFRQTDPLYIIDLKEPRNPSISGELEIEGYSDYLHPIGQEYLLGIGRDAFEVGDGGRDALVQGVKLSLFNVSDSSQPTEVQSMLIGQRGTNSNALSDHRAITIQAATDAHPMRLSFGIDVYGDASSVRSTDLNSASRIRDYNYSGLHGFDVRVGVGAEIVSRGVLRIDTANQDRRGYGSDRSVMVNNALFYIRDSKVFAAHWDDLSNSVAP